MAKRPLVRIAVLPVLLWPISLSAVQPARRPSVSALQAKHKNSKSPAPDRSRLDLARINDPGTRDPIGPHAQGEAVVRAEILLDRLKFSPGEITDSYGDNLAKAIAAFQAASGLPA